MRALFEFRSIFANFGGSARSHAQSMAAFRPETRHGLAEHGLAEHGLAEHGLATHCDSAEAQLQRASLRRSGLGIGRNTQGLSGIFNNLNGTMRSVI
jgi:hypothetical protein